MAHLDFEKPLAELEERIATLQAVSGNEENSIALELKSLTERVARVRAELYQDLTTWQMVQLSRHPDRPYFLDYLERIFDDFVELHGDRRFADDPAIVAGFARINDRSVAVIGQQKGRTTRQKVERNFGMPNPEGYRKACRIMELAERYGRPVFTFIDTPGAYPGLGAEERGQSEAIGQALLTMANLNVPIVATVIGEGGSGGALALGVANRVLMMQYATYSVITPEGCASILWRDGSRASDAAEQLKLLAADASALGVVDAIVPEPVGGAHRGPDEAATVLGRYLSDHLEELLGLSPSELRTSRYAKFRAMGSFSGENA